ncbi:SH3 domain-containing protein [Candidatus Uhrbacteria bacterium]|nr:SH3 domain-containing protein [Candidatus Uhrbacteria bacterium]
MKRLLTSLGIFIFLVSIIPNTAMAGGCYVDPVFQYSGTGKIKSAVFLRSEACTSGTMILRTLSAGATVQVVGYTDGWYEVISGGKRGWIGQQFLDNSAERTGVSWSNYEEYQLNRPSEVPSPAPEPTPTPATEETYTGTISERSLIKLVCPSSTTADHPCKAVYYIGADGKRHAFPNSKVFFTWYENFDSVKSVTSERLGGYMLGANVTYRPGTRMVKFTTDNKVYAVARGGILRWVASEELAKAFYGNDWNTKIDDIPDTFYTNYTFGTEIASENDFNPTSESAQSPTFD